MKKIVILLSVLFLLLQAGCTKSIRYTEEEIKDFPSETQDNIRKGQIALGMTQKQVRYAWGSPDSIRFLEPFDGKSREEWIYNVVGSFGVIGSKILFFFDGKLVYIK